MESESVFVFVFVSEDDLDDGFDADDFIRSAERFFRDIGTAKPRMGTLSLFFCKFASLRVTVTSGLVLPVYFLLMEALIGFSGLLSFRIDGLDSIRKVILSLVVLVNDEDMHDGVSHRIDRFIL